MYKNARNGCDAINEDLASKGVDEIGLIKSADVSLEFADFLNNYWPEYVRRHPLKQNGAGRSEGNSGPKEQPDGKSKGKVKSIRIFCISKLDKISVKNDDSVYVVFLLKILFIILINDLNIKNKCFTGHPFTFSSVSIFLLHLFIFSFVHINLKYIILYL
jgi:hypothetical protein